MHPALEQRNDDDFVDKGYSGALKGHCHRF